MSDKRTLEPTFLREYDIRGIIGPKFNKADFRSIGRGFGAILKVIYQSYGLAGLPVFLIKGTKSLEAENSEIAGTI